MMHKYSNQSLIQEARANLLNKTTSVKGDEQQASLARYKNTSILKQEIETIFNKVPTILLHSSEIELVNSFQTIETTLGSLIATRDDDGDVHVFHNACRHRGARLADGQGCSKRLICPYHAWSYNLNGELAGIPGQSTCFPSLDKANNKLIELPCVERYGFIWLCPSATFSDDLNHHLDRHLDAMRNELEELEFEQLMVFKRTSKIWAGNWKLFAEGGLETYHFAIAHRDTIAPYFHNNLAVIDQLGDHFRVFMPTRVLTKEDSQEQQQLTVPECSHTLFFLTPHTAILMQEEHIDMIQMRPVEVNATEISITSLIPKTTDLEDHQQQQHWQKNHNITNKTLDEDWSIGETIQASIDANALPYIQYGKNEWALHSFNQTLEKLMST